MPFAPPPPGQGGPADGPAEWYWSIPKITRCWFTAVIAATILTATGMLSPMTLYLDWPSIVNKFQVQDDTIQRVGKHDDVTRSF